MTFLGGEQEGKYPLEAYSQLHFTSNYPGMCLTHIPAPFAQGVTRLECPVPLDLPRPLD